MTDTLSPGLTRNPTDQSWGFICTEHGVHRYGLTERHALNVEAKHLREHHDSMATVAANVSLDLTAAAMFAAAAYGGDVQADPYRRSIEMWEAMLGLPAEEAKALALWMLGAEHHITAAVTPW